MQENNPFPVIILGIFAVALISRVVLPWTVASEKIFGIMGAVYVLLFIINYFLTPVAPPADRRVRPIAGTGEALGDEDELAAPVEVHRLPEPAGKVIFPENGKAVVPTTLEQWRMNQNEQ